MERQLHGRAISFVTAIVLASALAGCGKWAEVRKETAERRWLTGESRTIAVRTPTMIGRLDHAIIRSTRSQKAGKWAGEGAKGGAVLWAGMVMESDEGMGLALVLTPIVLPVFVIIGATGGAVAGASSAEPVVSRVQDPSDSAALLPAVAVFDSYAGAGFAEDLRDMLLEEGESISRHRLVIEEHGDEGDGSIEVSWIDVSLRSWNTAEEKAWLRFELTVNLFPAIGEFRRNASATSESKPYPLGDWAAAGGKLLREELDRAMRGAAHQVALDLLGKAPPEDHIPYVDPNLRRGRSQGLN